MEDGGRGSLVDGGGLAEVTYELCLNRGSGRRERERERMEGWGKGRIKKVEIGP